MVFSPVIINLLLPLAIALVAICLRQKQGRDVVQLLLALGLVANNVLFLGEYQDTVLHLLTIAPGLTIAFAPDGLSMLFLLIASILYAATLLFAFGYMRGNEEEHQGRFFACFGVSISATLGLAMAQNMLTLFLFYEILTLSTVPLVMHHGDREARRGGRIYVFLLLSTSILFLLGAIVWTYALTGSTDFVKGGLLAGKADAGLTGVLLMLYMFGIGKAALMPFHRWLPAAMVAPTPVSALLHAVAVVKAGVFTVVKVIMYIFGVEHLQAMSAENWWAGGWLVWIAGFTVLLASIIALKQDALKKRLAYSTVSQLGYVTMAAAMFHPQAIIVAGFHIAAHAVGKITLFFAAGNIYTASGKKYISELDGIGRRMPWTMGAFTLGALSMIGLPPAIGFLSKFYMLNTAFLTQHYEVVVVLVLSTLLNAAYFLPVIYAAFFKKEKRLKGMKHHREAPFASVVAITFTAACTMLLLLRPDAVLMLLEGYME